MSAAGCTRRVATRSRPGCEQPVGRGAQAQGVGGPASQDVVVEADPQRSVIRIRGPLDATSAPAVRTTFSEVAGRRTVVVLDQVTSVDSAGLGALLGGLRLVRETGGSAFVVCRPARILRLLVDVGVDRLVEIGDWPGLPAPPLAAST